MTPISDLTTRDRCSSRLAWCAPNATNEALASNRRRSKAIITTILGKVKKPNGRWRTRWCYLGKPNSQQELGHNQPDPGVIELGNKLGHTIGITPNPTKIEFMPSLSSSIDLLSDPANLLSSFHNVIPFNLGKITGPEGLEPSTSGSAGLRDSTTP